MRCVWWCCRNPEAALVLGSNYETICYVVERSVRRGASAAERIAAARLAAVLLLVSMGLEQAITDQVRLKMIRFRACCDFFDAKCALLCMPIQQYMVTQRRRVCWVTLYV